jgi:hypothetical protein
MPTEFGFPMKDDVSVDVVEEGVWPSEEVF